MSKPTMQVEELRSFARKMDELMPRRADLVREAADTIMRLRDDLQTQREVATDNTRRNMREYKRVRDENDKLRELVIDMHLTADEFSEKYERPFYVDKFLFRDNHIHKRERKLGIEVPE